MSSGSRHGQAVEPRCLHPEPRVGAQLRLDRRLVRRREGPFPATQDAPIRREPVGTDQASLLLCGRQPFDTVLPRATQRRRPLDREVRRGLASLESLESTRRIIVPLQQTEGVVGELVLAAARILERFQQAKRIVRRRKGTSAQPVIWARPRGQSEVGASREPYNRPRSVTEVTGTARTPTLQGARRPRW